MSGTGVDKGAATQEAATAVADNKPVKEGSLSPRFLRFMTPEESEVDPSILVVLQDEATLQLVVTAPHSPVQLLGPPAPPRPYTAALRTWLTALVGSHCSCMLVVIQPQLKTGNPPLPENVILLHQLKGEEVDSIMSDMEGMHHWTSSLRASNLSAGSLFVIGSSTRRSSIALHRPVAPFLAL
jgi:hypothetical protein